MGWGEPSTTPPLPSIELPGVVERGALVVVHIDDTTRDRAHEMWATLAAQIGHDEFGLLFAGEDVDVEVHAPEMAREAGWVYVGSPGVCPSCGGDDVVVAVEDIPRRACNRCGHRWVHYHSGRAA